MLKQEFSQHMFDELLFFFFPTKIELSYKVKNGSISAPKYNNSFFSSTKIRDYQLLFLNILRIQNGNGLHFRCNLLLTSLSALP